MQSSEETAKTLLAEGLDLCVRARKMDAQERTNAALDASSDPDAWVASGKFEKYVARHNITNPDTPLLTRSGTIQLWLQEQYESDLADWERRARHFLMQGS